VTVNLSIKCKRHTGMEKDVNLFIEATVSEPFISFSDGILKISGRSIPTDTSRSFNQLIETFYRYSRKPKSKTEIHIELEYINSASNRSLLNLLIVAEYLYKEALDVNVKWYYHDDEDIMLEQGQIFSELLTLPINFIKKDKSDYRS
jgi:hypothetical protein